MPTNNDSPFILDLLESLKRRSKSLKHKNAVPEIARFVETREGVERQRVEITIRKRSRQQLIITAWDDRTIRLHACESVWQAGWKFQHTCTGRFIGSDGGREIVQALEESLLAMFEMTARDEAKLDRIWAPLLAKGPQPL